MTRLWNRFLIGIVNFCEGFLDRNFSRVLLVTFLRQLAVLLQRRQSLLSSFCEDLDRKLQLGRDIKVASELRPRRNLFLLELLVELNRGRNWDYCAPGLLLQLHQQLFVLLLRHRLIALFVFSR